MLRIKAGRHPLTRTFALLLLVTTASAQEINPLGKVNVESKSADKAGALDPGTERVPAQVKSIVEQADAAFAGKDFPKARRLFEDVLRLDPSNSHALLYHADTYFSENNFDQAIKGFDRALAVVSDNPITYHWRGDAWARLNKPHEAIADYTKALELSPKRFTCFAERADQLAKIGEYQRAIIDFTVVIEFTRNGQARAQLYAGRARAWQKAGEELAAVADFAQAARLHHDDGQLWNAAAWILATSPNLDVRDGVRAVKYAQYACKSSDDPKPFIIDTLAASYAEAGEYQFAAALQDRSIARLKSPAEKADYEVRRALYKSKRPYRSSSAALATPDQNPLQAPLSP